MLIILIIFFSNIQIATSLSESEETLSFFTVEEHNGRWRFIDPEGKPFFSTGVCGVRAAGTSSPDLGYSPYYEYIMQEYGSEEEWANITYDRLLDWGFNTIASWSDQYIINKGLPYCHTLGLANDNWETGEVSDYFSDEWINYVEGKCSTIVANMSNDTQLIGYFLDNEIHWCSDWRSLLDLFDTYMKLPAKSPGKTALVNFLKERYDDNISSFNLAWRTSLNSFNEIHNETYLGIWPYTVKARIDHNDFVAEQFFRICYEKIKKYDSNHLILGVRFQSYSTPIEVVKACKNYVDVVSVNHYVARPYMLLPGLIYQDLLGLTRPLFMLKEFHDLTDKPIVISEFYFRAKDSGLPNTKPSRLFMPVVKTQRQRALCFEVYARYFLDQPYSIGYHWFSYADQPKEGRSDGEDSNIGLVDKEDKPYTVLINSMKRVNGLATNKVK